MIFVYTIPGWYQLQEGLYKLLSLRKSESSHPDGSLPSQAPDIPQEMHKTQLKQSKFHSFQFLLKLCYFE